MFWQKKLFTHCLIDSDHGFLTQSKIFGVISCLQYLNNVSFRPNCNRLMADKTYWTGSDKYLCDPELAQSFHMARVLGMPLLIEGEPGTGKTELPLQYSQSLDLDMHVYPVGSKSNVDAFVAKFDHVKYLRDSQIEVLNAQREQQGMTTNLSTGGRNTEVLDDYVIHGPAAKAYTSPHSVLLIDEIDKAPREFPNDLLYALSHRKFVLPESGKVIEVSEDEMPAIVVTSNREQELPTAFKGRCIYHYINFPDSETMIQIVAKHYPTADEELVEKAMGLFYQLRDLGLERSPSTRELLNWMKYLQTFESKEALAKIKDLHGMGALVKTQVDMERVQRRILGKGGSASDNFNNPYNR